MPEQQRFHWAVVLGTILSGCESRPVRPPPSPPPPLASLAEDLAVDCQFLLDGVAVSESEIASAMASGAVSRFTPLSAGEEEPRRMVGLRFRLVNPERHPGEISCRVVIVGRNSNGPLLTFGSISIHELPEGDGFVQGEGALRLPDRAGEYELRALIRDGEKHRLICRCPFRITESS